MNVAQVNQSVNVVSSKGKPAQVHGKSFSEEFKKYYTSSAEKDLATEDSESEGLDKELSDSEEETQKELEFATFSLINPFLKLDAEVTDLNQTLEEGSLARLTNEIMESTSLNEAAKSNELDQLSTNKDMMKYGKIKTIDSEISQKSESTISQMLKPDTATNDLSDEEQSFILHNEPTDNESNLFTEKQSNISEMQGKQNSNESLDDTKPLSEGVPQAQTKIVTPLSDFTQTLDSNSLSSLVKEISGMMESTELNETAKSTELELSLVIKDILKTDKLEPIDPETLQKIVSSLKEVLNTEKETSQRSTNKTDVEQIIQSAVSDVDSLKQVGEEPSKTKQTVNPIPVNSTEEQKSVQMEKIDRSMEMQATDLDAEVTEKLGSAKTVKNEITQADTDYDFVSMLRQLSNQSTKESGQVVAKSNTEASVTVPKEQSINLIQDMVTHFAENKEGQKTYQTTLHLSPETLGKVTIELSLNEEGLSGKLTFQSDETRKWMEGEWLDLKLPLESKGLTIKAFDFTTSQPATQQQNGSSFSEHSSQSEQDARRQSLSENQQLLLAENDDQAAEMSSNDTTGINVYV